MNKIRIISLFGLVFFFAFFLGLYIRHAQVWPYTHFKEVIDFIAGDAEEYISFQDKLKNDFNFKPSRHIKTAEKGSGRWLQFNKGFESKDHKALEGLKLNPRREKPRIFLSDNAPKGYRLIQGTFDFDKTLHGAILLDPKGKVKRVWYLTQEGLDWDHQKDPNVFPHGLVIAPDGSIVIAFDEGTSLTKYDYCGKTAWQIKGRFHHSISFENENIIWVWKRRMNAWIDTAEILVKVDYTTGKILKEIPLVNVMDANPDIDILGSMQNDTPEGSRWADTTSGFWHVNDIDPLTKKFEQYYPSFRAGDLLLSLRTPNLIFIIDQETLKVKWWRQGLTRRQHDPDWNNSKGTITIFNNNMHRGFSEIKEINPITYTHSVILKGEKYNFYTWWRGKHQIMPSGGVLTTSSDQGRVFETDAKGNITFEFINTYKKGQEYLVISEALFLPLNYFKELPQCE
jgi:hypothetical protein